MRAIRWTPVVLLLSIALAACNSSNSDMGVGPELYTASLPENTKAQNDYVAAICTQAGGQVIQLSNSIDCSAPDGWTAFVQAGMNDIDARCDAYLVWLDQRKRRAKPILKQIGDTQDATTSIIGIAYPGSNAITILTEVFALAKNTFENVNNGLLLEVDHSTVQAVVLRRQKEFRDAILGKSVGNRPAAMYALRSYLRICMPITIATDINTTITGLERGDRAPDPLIDAGTVARTMIESPNSRVIFLPAPGQQGQGGGGAPSPAADYPSTLPAPYVRSLQASLCVTRSGTPDAATKEAVRLYLATKRANPATWTKANEPALSTLIAEVPECAASLLANAYEVAVFGVPDKERQARIRIFQQQLQKYFSVKEPSFVVPETGDLDQRTREGIAEARKLTGIGANLPSEQRSQLDAKLRTAILLVSQGNN